MFPFIGFGSITGRPQDKLRDMMGEELAHWSIDVLKGSARGVKHTALTAGSCIAMGLKYGDENSRCAFDKRFVPQVISRGWGFVSSKGSNNPISKITELVILDAKKNRPSSISKAVAKFVFSNRLKSVSVNVLISQISSYLVDITVARFVANKTAQGIARGAVTLGVGLAIGVGDVAEQSYQVVLRLKIKNNKLYSALYSRNLECFWFLVEDNLKDFAYKNG